MIDEQAEPRISESLRTPRFKTIQIILLVGLVPTAIGLYAYQWSSIRRYLEPSAINASAGSGTARPGSGSSRAEAFDLSQCVVPTRTLMSGGPPKDGIPALTDPAKIEAGQADYLRPDDRIIGVAIGNEAVAYPIRMLNYHECVNDKVGDHAFAVTYCPLCDSAFVFDREVGGRVLEFGISGLLLNSNVLLYDRQARPVDESLWSQVAMKAACGPAAKAGAKLELIPSELVTWSDWKGRHPDTQVLSENTGHNRDYSRSLYGPYFRDDQLMFPVEDIFEDQPPTLASYRNKEPAIVVRSASETRIYPFTELLEKDDGSGRIQDNLGSEQFALVLDKDSQTVRLEPKEGFPETLKSAYTFWFAWRSLQEDYEVFRGE